MKHTRHSGSFLVAAAGFWKDIRLTASLVRAYVNGEYRNVSWLTVSTVLFTLLYLLSPLDLMTDAVPVIGWLDDVVVLVIGLKVIHRDLQKFRRFRDRQIYDGKKE